MQLFLQWNFHPAPGPEMLAMRNLSIPISFIHPSIQQISKWKFSKFAKTLNTSDVEIAAMHLRSGIHYKCRNIRTSESSLDHNFWRLYCSSPHFSKGLDSVNLVFIIKHLSLFFCHWVVSSSLQLHGLQHARPPCPSPSPGVRSNSCPLSWW